MSIFIAKIDDFRVFLFSDTVGAASPPSTSSGETVRPDKTHGTRRASRNVRFDVSDKDDKDEDDDVEDNNGGVLVPAKKRGRPPKKSAGLEKVAQTKKKKSTEAESTAGTKSGNGKSGRARK